MPRPLPHPHGGAPLVDFLPFAEVRLIVFDVDGTLTETQTRRSHWNRFLSLKRSLEGSTFGVQVTIATGRSMGGTEELLNSMELRPKVPAVFFNGALVGRLKRQEFIRVKRLAIEDTKRVLDIASRYGPTVLCYFIAVGFETPLLGGRTEHVLGIHGRVERGSDIEVNNMNIEWVDTNSLRELLERLAPTAIVLEFGSSTLRQRKASIIELNRAGVKTSVTTSGWVEVAPSGVDKAEAIQFVSSKLGVAQEHTMAVGDGENDAAMLRWAGIGIAVPEAAPAALRTCDFVTRNSTAQGAAVEALLVVQMAKHLLRSKRV